ncbi:mediator complex subunit Med5-domain-containing protein [Kockovaella imperatae]|uniref:Mediator of RNA polymerase II transcription subunit 5 n=1 Tax=Kockovaella imperatae TaxID=4999 RepID=A0A1Y1UM03_9TREE|nr:mediator complex subunit Med5-domain-containing protein [Kockovaella imperatae]ORX39073.1 mediator complex subunit Med5-domain-containing protein [Kockovaella imperatae]
MANEDMELPDLVRSASNRGLSALKFVPLVTSWLAKKALEDQQSQDALTDALLSCLVSPHPPANILGYLTQCLLKSTITARTLAIHLLIYIYDGRSLSESTIISLSGLVMGSLTGLEPTSTIPSSLNRPIIPDIGSSDASQSIPTLSLLLPLLRQCTLPAAPAIVISFVHLLLSILEKHPAPPLDVGLEAGSLLQLLPEQLGLRLRDCLSGLMADLTDQNQLLNTTQQASGLPISAIPPLETRGDIPVPALPSGPLQLPLAKALQFTIIHALSASRWTPSPHYAARPPRLPENYSNIIRLGPQLCSDPATFLLHLLRTAVNIHNGEYVGSTFRGGQRWIFMTEHLPALIRWWKDQNIPDWACPEDIVTPLSTVFELETSPIEQKNGYVSGVMKQYISAADMDEEAGSFVHPEGWMLCTEQITILQRYSEFGLLNSQQLASLSSNISIPSHTPGESLMHRVASASKSHIRPISHIVIYAPGAARSFATEIMECISACPSVPPPEGLFVNLASEPDLLTAICGYVNSATILEAIQQHLLDVADDRGARAEDPQGALTRFGEAVILAEALVAIAELDPPELLRDARRSLNLPSMDEMQKSCVNGWVKALFGPDGIDDQVLLVTSPADFYRLAPSLIQQAITATAAGMLDLPTLHSGLSYFSQSLLSWSLGGITDWLCTEIVRNGHLSALHLNVLQNLVCSGALPVALLRVTGPAIASLLLPTSGLAPVFQSSAFDARGVQSKLNELNIAPQLSSVNALEDLRSEIQIVRNLNLAPESWASSLIKAMERALRVYPTASVSHLILEQLLQPTSALSGELDPFTAFSCLLLDLRFKATSPITGSQSFIDASIPALFDVDSAIVNDQIPISNLLLPVTSLCRATKHILLFASALNASQSDTLAHHLIDELLHLRARISTDGQEKNAKVKRRDPGMNSQQKAVLEALAGALGADEELRDRWSRFGELVGSPR